MVSEAETVNFKYNMVVIVSRGIDCGILFYVHLLKYANAFIMYTLKMETRSIIESLNWDNFTSSWNCLCPYCHRSYSLFHACIDTVFLRGL